MTRTLRRGFAEVLGDELGSGVLRLAFPCDAAAAQDDGSVGEPERPFDELLDEQGFVTIVDRKKDIIIRGGENVSAAEVEELLIRMPGVAEVAVVAAPDPRLGEHGCAFVRMQPGGGDVPALEEMREHLAAGGLAKQKWPEELRPIEEFPRTSSGKIQKFVLRQRVRDE